MVSAASTSDKRGHHLRVLSVGLPRTGSKSMLRALEILGYRNVHHLGQIWWKPREWAFLDRAADASFPSLSTYRPDLCPVDWDEMFGENEAITDAAGIFGPQLIEAYPDAKCVMVVRDFDAWARSVDETLLSYLFSWFKCPPSIAPCGPLFAIGPRLLDIVGTSQLTHTRRLAQRLSDRPFSQRILNPCYEKDVRGCDEMPSG